MDKHDGESQNIWSQPTELASLVSYQEGSVVSRTIIDKKVGTITLFAFGQGQGLSEHTVPYDALVYVFDGTTEISISGETSILHEGEMMVLPAGEPHVVRAQTNFKMMLVMIRA
jgi:quercetin dioxygenase-like cupin family protein